MALTLLATNNAESALASAISATDTSLIVSAGTGAEFPDAVDGVSYFKLTIIDAATGAQTEIVNVTAKAGDIFTIERAQEGTLARAWSANDFVANMMTADTLNVIADYTQQAGESAAQAIEAADNASEYAENKFTFYKTSGDPDGTIAGLAATTTGQSFRVAQGPAGTTAFKTYENQDGVAVLQAAQPGTAAVTGTVREYSTLTLAQNDVAAGNILDGAKCWVTNAADGTLADEYINVSGALTLTGRRQVSQEFVEKVDSKIPAIPVRNQSVPLYVDESGNVPVFLTDGDLDVRGVSDGFVKKIDGRVQGFGTQQLTAPERMVPLFEDESGNVTVCLEDGNLSARGLSDSLLNIISTLFSSSFQMREAPLASTKPVATDGRTLFKFKSKLGRILSGVTLTPRIMITGDSWAEYVAIPQAIYNLIQTKYFVSNSSYISVNGQFMLNSATFAKSSGWVLYDASAVSTGPVNGCGPDGQSISTTAADQSITITAQPCTQVNILCQDLTGTFRYRIDGGSWTVVVGAGTSAMKRITVNSLADAAHSIDIDTTGNTGTVAIHGIWCPRAVKGVEIQKCGNAGITGSGITNYYTQIQQYASFMQPDLIFIILGTNDFRLSQGTSSYVDGLRNMILQYKAAYQQTGVVLISPARCNATGSIPSSSYRDAMANLAMELGVEFFNFHDDWDIWSVMNGYGVWVDSLHLNDSGAAGLAKSLDKHFLSL